MAEQDDQAKAAQGESESATGPAYLVTAQAPVEPSKRISESNPRELELAFRQVLNQPEKGSPAANLAAAENESDSEAVEKKESAYKNGFNLWADIFYGVLVAPRQTMMILSDSSRFPPTASHIGGAVLLVLAALTLTASLKLKVATVSLSYFCTSFASWFTLTLILYYLSIWMRGHRLTLGNAFIATGWAYLPMLFFAPVACLKQTALFAVCGPAVALWLIILQWIAFQTSLRTSATKLALILIVVPPIFVFVYLFWIGLASFALLNTLINSLRLISLS
jgi:Yip1 domain